MESSFEEVREIYAGMPLREDFFTAGAKALAGYSIRPLEAPRKEGNEIVFRAYSCKWFDEDGLDEMTLDNGMTDEESEEYREELMECKWTETVHIVTEKRDGTPVVSNVYCECEEVLLDYWDTEDRDDWLYNYLPEESFLICIELAEVFLNAAIA